LNHSRYHRVLEVLIFSCEAVTVTWVRSPSRIVQPNVALGVVVALMVIFLVVKAWGKLRLSRLF
jgi:hypothetical protein